MSRTGTLLAGVAVVAAVGLIVLDQSGHRSVVEAGTVVYAIAVVVVGVVAHLRRAQPEPERSARSAFARMLRGGPLPPDPSQDAAIRQLADEHRTQMSGHRWAPWITFAWGFSMVVGGALNERPRSTVIGAAVVLLAVGMRPMRRRRLARLDRLDAALDARAASARPGPAA